MCQYCEETSCISHATFYPRNWIDSGEIEIIQALVRLDVIPEDDLFQIDCEVTGITNDLRSYGEWSCDCLDINYCPMCGRKLRE